MEEGPERAAESEKSSKARQSERLLTIGQVVAQLQPEFPDLSITKVRYLEDRGLLSPVRTKGRYRKYGTTDIRRLRTILELQRDDYLPLEVIRRRVERAVSPSSGQPMTSDALAVRSHLTVRREEPAYTLEEMCEASGTDEAFIRMLIEYHLIASSATPGVVFTESEVETARICHLLARYGVEPRNLRLLASSTEREAAVIEQITAPSLRSNHPDKREYGEKMLEELGALFSQLVRLLLYKELRRLL